MGKRKARDDDDGHEDYRNVAGPSYSSALPRLENSTSLPEAKRKKKESSSLLPPIAKPEKRKARHRPKCPQNILQRLDRVLSQRFFLVDRTRNGNELREVFQILGSVGNIYQVVIDEVPSCSCPDARKGNHCKHIVFVFLKVLNQPTESPYWYQKALLTTELEQVFAHAKPNPSIIAPRKILDAYGAATGSPSKLKHDDNLRDDEGSSEAKTHKNPEGDDCAICYEEMKGSDEELEKELVWCETCDKAVHQECFGQWSTTARSTSGNVTCVYCRAPWTASDIASGSASTSKTTGGYLNIGGAGLQRDTSSYYHGPKPGVRMSHLGRYYDRAYEDEDC